MDGQVGPESDQYAIGVLLYVCLTQQLPYGDYQNLRLLRAIQEGKFEPPRKHRPDLPEGLEAIILRAMHVSAEGPLRMDPRARASAVGVRQPARPDPVEELLLPHARQTPSCATPRSKHPR